MPKSTARKARNAAPGLGAVYPYRNGYRGAVTWTEPDGRRHKRVVSGRTADEARGKLDEIRRELRLGTLAPDDALTVGEYLTEWIADERDKVRESTWRTTAGYVNAYLIPAFGRRRLAALDVKDVELAMRSWRRVGRPGGAEARRRPVSAVTVQHVRATLRHALNDALRRRLVTRNVAEDAEPPAAEKRPITYLSARDVGKLLTATADSDLGPLYALAATTGLRRGELLGLTWADVEGGIVRVRRAMGRTAEGWGIGKVKSERSRRTLPLPLRAREAIETERTRQLFRRNAAGDAWQDRDGLVFTDAVGRPLLPEYVSHRFARDVNAAGVPRVRFHDLRHTAATALLSAGVPMAVISEWLGHSGIQITASSYAAVVPELLTDAAEAMDRAMAGAS